MVARFYPASTFPTIPGQLHPVYGQGLLSCYAPQAGMRDRAVGGFWTTSGTIPLGGTPCGAGHVVNPLGYIVPPSVIPITAGSDWTCIVWNFGAVFNGTNPGIWRTAENSFCIFQGSTGRPWIRTSGGDALNPRSGYTPVVSGYSHPVGYRFKNASYADFWSLGTRWFSSSHALSQGAATIPAVGFQFNAAESYSGTYCFFGFWKRYLTDPEMMTLTTSPTAIFL